MSYQRIVAPGDDEFHQVYLEEYIKNNPELTDRRNLYQSLASGAPYPNDAESWIDEYDIAILRKNSPSTVKKLYDEYLSNHLKANH